MNYKSLLASFAILISNTVSSQCGTAVTNGSSGNMFTQIRNSTNPVAVDKALNTVVFIHRNNNLVNGGNSGHLRYDVSTNGGTSFTVDYGNLNPINTSLARYPNVAIYSATNNTNPNSAYVCYMAATISSSSSAWNGLVEGATQVGTNNGTENYNVPVTAPQLIPHSLVKGAPGVYWAVDGLFNGINITGYAVYKGVWTPSVNSVSWVTNYTVTPPFNTGYNGTPQVGDYNIAFDPTGQTGWLSFLGHVSPGPTGYAYYPVFYKTTNGGATWTGPIQVDLNTLSCITQSIASGGIPTTNFEHDLVVDVNGNPHLVTTICYGTGAYAVQYTQTHRMYDITMQNGLWVARDIASVQAGRGTFGATPNITTLDMSPQAARSADGTKVFFSWVDNTNYTLGQANQTPDLFSRAYDVTQNKWTNIKNFSSCNMATSGKMFYTHLASEVLEPSSGMYKIAPVYAEFTSGTDPALQSNFKFLDGCTFAIAEFSINPPAAPTISLSSGPSLLLCPGSTVNVSVVGGGSAIWSNGVTSTVLPVSQSSLTTYSVIAQVGCGTGTAALSVSMLSVSVSSNSTAACVGQTVGFSVNGNATNYTWMPSGQTGTSYAVTASTASVFTVIAGVQGCSTTYTTGFNILPLPTVSISGSTVTCQGTAITLTASGAATYTWSSGGTSSTETVSPVASSIYTVSATGSNGCGSSGSFTVNTLPLPLVTVSSDQSTVCAGKPVILTAFGAQTFTWLPSTINWSYSATPSVTGVYTVNGEDANNCIGTQTIGIIVYPNPTLSAVASRTLFCKSEKTVTLTVNGASTYTWMNGPFTSTYGVTPQATSVYTVTGSNTNGCKASTTVEVAYSTCSGIENWTLLQQATLYPNPTNGLLTISNLSSGVRVTLFDATGRMVYEKTTDGDAITIDLAGYNKGVYVINLTSDTSRRTIKVIHN